MTITITIYEFFIRFWGRGDTISLVCQTANYVSETMANPTQAAEDTIYHEINQ